MASERGGKKSEDVGKRQKADLLGQSGYGKELELNPDW